MVRRTRPQRRRPVRSGRNSSFPNKFSLCCSKKPGRHAGLSFFQRARLLAMQGKSNLCCRHEHVHQSNKEALLGMRPNVLAHFMIGSREKNSQRFILAEGYKSPIPAREGHRDFHSHEGCNRNAGREYLKPITCEADHVGVCASCCTQEGKSSKE